MLKGDRERSLDNLENAFEDGFTVDPNFSTHYPMFEPLDDDPRFRDIMGRMMGHLNSERTKLGMDPIEHHYMPSEQVN